MDTNITNNIGTKMLIKHCKKIKKELIMGKVNENNLVVKLKKELGAPKSKLVKFKAVVDNELADAIEYIMANSKRAFDTEPSVYFGKKVLENNRKALLDLKKDMEEFLESEQEDEQLSEQNGAEK